MPTWLAWIAGREGGSGAMAAMLGTREERGKGGTRQGRKGLEAPHSSKERKALLAQATPPEADGPHRAKHLRRRGRHRAARAFQGGIARRSEGRRVGNAGVRTCRSRWAPERQK